MKNIVLIFYLFYSTLYALSLDELIDKSLSSKPSLEAINHRITASKLNVDVSNQFDNPSLSLASNSLDNKQAMSRTTLTLQQKLPYFGKRDSLQKVAKSQEELLSTSLEKAKVTLVNEIKNQAYSIWELEELYKIIKEYEHFMKQSIELSESYTATSDNQHMGIMSAELEISNLHIQMATLEAKIEASYAKLSYLANFQVDDLTVDLSISDLPSKEVLQTRLANNKELLLKESEIKKRRAIVKTAELNNYPDINLLASYSYRENFDDFMSVGVGLTLPIYGTEDSKEEEAQALTLSSVSLKEDTKVAINSEFETAYAQMRSAYKIYHIVYDEALPQIEHMFELTNSSIATGGDLFKYIDILVKKLKLEQKSITAITSYNRSFAKIQALSGEIK